MECGAVAVAAAVSCAQAPSPWLPKRRSNCRSSTRVYANASSSSSSGNADSSEAIASTQGVIQLEFVGPKEDSYATSVPSGEKILRNVMLDTKLELYGLYGKVMNCGGIGNCGTCTVEIVEGQELLSERTDAEKRRLKKKPGNWRLACQTIVGDKSNSGKVVVQRLPQQKKN